MEKIWTRRMLYTSEKKTWQNPLMPYLNVLKVLGHLPFVRAESGRIEFNLVSLPMVWAVVVTSFKAAMFLVQVQWVVMDTKLWSTFDECLSTLNGLVFFTYFTHGPLLTWSKTKSITDSINMWTDFHESFQRITKKPIRSSVFKYFYLGFLLPMSTVCRLMFGALQHNPSILNILLNVSLSMVVVYEATLLLTWAVFCLTVKTAANILKESLVQKLVLHLKAFALLTFFFVKKYDPEAKKKVGTKIPSPQLFITYRSLWFHLHKCTLNMTQAMAQTLQACIAIDTFLFILNIYIILMFAFEDHGLDVSFSVEYILFNGFCIWMILTMGYITQKSMRDDFLSAIYSQKWLQLSDKSQTEVELFLDLIQMSKPCFNLPGTFVITRCKELSVIQQIVTFLVCMMQLKGSATRFCLTTQI